ncbi:MAG: hypothetical protein EB098_07710, partial [Betaproteobacteria bacterium]|nr:hypothetical protein [Betaproteobacteria bacterium]
TWVYSGSSPASRVSSWEKLQSLKIVFCNGPLTLSRQRVGIDNCKKRPAGAHTLSWPDGFQKGLYP